MECSLSAMGSYFSRRPCSREASGTSLGERHRRGRTTSGKRELSCGVADLNHDVSILLPGEEARGARKCFDDDHAAAAAWAWMREDAARVDRRHWGACPLARMGDVVGAGAGCESRFAGGAALAAPRLRVARAVVRTKIEASRTEGVLSDEDARFG
jgi:hypothetical protein